MTSPAIFSWHHNSWGLHHRVVGCGCAGVVVFSGTNDRSTWNPGDKLGLRPLPFVDVFASLNPPLFQPSVFSFKYLYIIVFRWAWSDVEPTRRGIASGGASITTRPAERLVSVLWPEVLLQTVWPEIHSAVAEVKSHFLLLVWREFRSLSASQKRRMDRNPWTSARVIMSLVRKEKATLWFLSFNPKEQGLKKKRD